MKEPLNTKWIVEYMCPMSPHLVRAVREEGGFCLYLTDAPKDFSKYRQYFGENEKVAISGTIEFVRALEKAEPGLVDSKLWPDLRWLSVSNWYATHYKWILNQEIFVTDRKCISHGILGEFLAGDKEFFVRPNQSDKSFNGQVVSTSTDIYTIVPNDQLVVVSPVQALHSEYRCIVVNNMLVSIVRYKNHVPVDVEASIPSCVLTTAMEILASRKCPNDSCTMDLALTASDDVRLIEFNSFASADFYHVDLEHLVSCVDKYKA